MAMAERPNMCSYFGPLLALYLCMCVCVCVCVSGVPLNISPAANQPVHLRLTHFSSSFCISIPDSLIQLKYAERLYSGGETAETCNNYLLMLWQNDEQRDVDVGKRPSGKCF